ncbi:OLC1v1004460C1 [Oldenlandia corymbosa var. corymbosa]|uniref:OLC1v1004460C1 n=1 Tax=Oldenlandia corymbosa var. corymbosa TaxID=529605 RepID=A0AAV1DF08_OLDCO|nr:OLC1v1004460C1 [Oldenlandia corymbosa var. corymbosa]
MALQVSLPDQLAFGASTTRSSQINYIPDDYHRNDGVNHRMNGYAYRGDLYPEWGKPKLGKDEFLSTTGGSVASGAEKWSDACPRPTKGTTSLAFRYKGGALVAVGHPPDVSTTICYGCFGFHV